MAVARLLPSSRSCLTMIDRACFSFEPGIGGEGGGGGTVLVRFLALQQLCDKHVIDRSCIPFETLVGEAGERENPEGVGGGLEGKGFTVLICFRLAAAQCGGSSLTTPTFLLELMEAPTLFGVASTYPRKSLV